MPPVPPTTAELRSVRNQPHVHMGGAKDDGVVFKHKTPSLVHAVACLSNLSLERVTGLTDRVLLHLTEGSNAALFTEQEERALGKKMKTDDVKLALEGVQYMVQHLGYLSSTTEQAADAVRELGGSDAAAEGVQAAWGEAGKHYLQALRSRGLGGPSVLRNVTYDSQLLVADDVRGPTHVPNSVLQLHLGETHANTSALKSEERLALTFTHEKLYEFFKDIDAIQGKVDAISSGNQ